MKMNERQTTVGQSITATTRSQ